MLEVVYKKVLPAVKGKSWWFTCYKRKDTGEIVYYISCNDFRKYVYTEQNGFRQSSSCAKEYFPKTVQRAFLDSIKP